MVLDNFLVSLDTGCFGFFTADIGSYQIELSINQLLIQIYLAIH